MSNTRSDFEAAYTVEANAAPAGERAAFEARFSKVYDLDFDEETEEYRDLGDQALWYGYQAGAAWQRQSTPQPIAVPDGVLLELLHTAKAQLELHAQEASHPGQYRLISQIDATLKLAAPSPATVQDVVKSQLVEALEAARAMWGDYLPPGNSKAMKAMRLVDAAIAAAQEGGKV